MEKMAQLDIAATMSNPKAASSAIFDGFNFIHTAKWLRL